MGQAKLRRQSIQAAASGSIPESGLYFLHKRHGISVVLVIRRGDGQQVHAGLFCVDDWQEGFFQCLGRTYELIADFREDFKAHGGKFRPSSAEESRRRIAYGLRICRETASQLPEHFPQWSFLLGSLDNVWLPESIFRCPRCEAPLPTEVSEEILSNITKGTNCYIECDTCREREGDDFSVEETILPHSRARGMFEGMESFSINWQENETQLLMAIPGERHRRAIASFDDDPVLTAAFALETWMNRATKPNGIVTDKHVERALEVLLAARREDRPLPESSNREVEFVRKAAEEGLDAFVVACADQWDITTRERSAAGGIEKVLKSVRNHQAVSDPRSYIKFIAKYLK